MFSVYLAGRINGLDYDEAMVIRKEITNKLNNVGISCRTPLRGKAFLKTKGVITEETYETSISIQEIIKRDLSDINLVDAVVILTGDDPSWGTSAEFWYATWIANKPTLVLYQNGEAPAGWLKHHATRIVKTIDDAVDILSDWKMYWNDGEGIYDID